MRLLGLDGRSCHGGTVGGTAKKRAIDRFELCSSVIGVCEQNSGLMGGGEVYVYIFRGVGGLAGMKDFYRYLIGDPNKSSEGSRADPSP